MAVRGVEEIYKRKKKLVTYVLKNTGKLVMNMGKTQGN